ncbi:signal peptide peptidase SppA [Aureimonas fodinaquatilis]|uniref:Signal peptide peptidase SppA n=1 Tax=Aureimonas fodinaquatilis TaxID=2565783 RepID=A0A5B0DPY7_9HYPH|nr:signal peptide peptidase SppA [Aureimonas fodinaquatilis]KAA0968546.1 signal peptide peptidase SppA [Aureimonas fodinaquatilis]
MTAQDWIDRRRLRRKLGFWRLAALALVLLALVAGAFYLGGAERRFPGGAQIASVKISGVITEDDDRLKLLEKLGQDPSVQAVVLKINSPGGTTVGGETLYHAVRRLAEKKPVVAEIGTLGASAAYMVALGADRIVAHNSSIVGSIGVIFQYADASRLMETVGVRLDAVRSGPLKAEPSPFAPAPAEAIEMIRRLVMNSYDWFVGIVVERRPLDEAVVRRLADGSIFTGEQGLANGLVDALGGDVETRRWLEEEKGVSPALRVVEHEPSRKGGLPFFRSAVFSVLGLSPDAETLSEALFGKGAQLDGLLSLWQPFPGRSEQ